MPLTVFVTDGDQRPALAIVRALGRRGLRVIVGDERANSLASLSKYCARHVRYPSPCEDPDGFVRFLRGFLAREPIDVLLPVTDVTMHLVCREQRWIGDYTSLAVPPFDGFNLVTDKARLVEYASKLGVQVPRTVIVRGPSDLAAAADRVVYPIVVKPVRSRTPTAAGWVPGSAHYVRSRAELEYLYGEHDYLARYPSLIQQRIVGNGVGTFVLFDRGRIVAEFAHRRLREKPPSGGASVLSESVAVDPRWRDEAARLLSPLGWHGVAMIEYKEDARTGERFLMEINGRFWGSLQLAIDAGVDFPYLTCALARADSVEPPPYVVGLRNRWIFGDLDHLLLRLARSRAALDLPDEAPSKARVLIDFLKLAQPGLRYEVVSADDWRPFVHQLREYVTGTAR
jgi:predicted ATP-grasp superfamily ATP-dependent carboligase